jgi:dTDP-4-dehydrorhamnose 3,5-epimerase
LKNSYLNLTNVYSCIRNVYLLTKNQIEKFLKIISTKIPGCFELLPKLQYDARGVFVKTFHAPTFKKFGLATSFKEQYYSISKKNVIRGLHFQTPPYDHAKLIYCTNGEVIDVALDLRIGSPYYGKHISIILNAKKCNMIYIPSGFAHGFCSLSNTSTLVYNTTTVYDSNKDTGVRWDTAGISWPIKKPNLSNKDLQLQDFKNFNSPFVFDV